MGVEIIRLMTYSPVRRGLVREGIGETSELNTSSALFLCVSRSGHPWVALRPDALDIGPGASVGVQLWVVLH